MSKTLSSEDIDFTKGDLNGWELIETQYPSKIKRDRDEYYLSNEAPYGWGGMDLQKNIPNLEVGKYYKYSMRMRTHGPRGMGVQVIVGNGNPGAHIALRVEIEDHEVKVNEWHTLEGLIFIRNPVSALVILNSYSWYDLDIDKISMSLIPLGPESISALSKDRPHAKRQL